MIKKNDTTLVAGVPISLEMKGNHSVGIASMTGGELHLHLNEEHNPNNQSNFSRDTREMKIVVPERILFYLESNPSFIEWLSYVSTFFTESPHYYSEYSYQGISHINESLKYIDHLIPENQKLSEKTVMVLVASVVVHDIGRQLTPLGFSQLLALLSWKEKWVKYYSRSSRFSDAEQIKRFGKAINVIETFPKGKVDATTETADQSLVISDFFHERHGDIAYEMVTKNTDFNTGKSIFTFDIENDLRDLIGRISQSHKYPLRKAEPLIKNSRYGGMNSSMPMEIPAYYLMALLRLADKLDARARKWLPPIGMMSDEKHSLKNVMRSIKFPPDSPFQDAVWIDTCPRDTRTFVVTKEWIEDTQHELDYAWAALSEKYGSEYAITVHRIYSNVTDETTELAFQKDFVTEKPYLKADTNILKHLIAPLYGGDASYGVRELTANAVDAINERIYISKTQRHRPFVGFDSIINVSISEGANFQDDGCYVFAITDTGIGMTLDVILNYYLTSGVSFRESDEWKRLFDSGKKVRVTRTGRFGVGALAAFLLGDSVTVTTRHMDEKEKGYRFTFSLNSEIINIERVECDIGTTIEVPITNTRYNLAMQAIPRYLKPQAGKMSKSASTIVRIGEQNDLNDEESVQYTGFGCYRYQKPKIVYNYCGAYLNIQFNNIPSKDDIRRGRFSDWFSYESEGYFIAWKPPSASPRKQVRFFLNGFKFNVVTNKIQRDFGCDMGYPIFSAEDTLGFFLCDLARDKITLPTDFILELFRYKMALLFRLNVKNTITSRKPSSDLFSNGKYSIVFSEKGYTISNRMFLGHTRIEEYFGHNCTSISNFATTDINLPMAQYGISFISDKLNTLHRYVEQGLQEIIEHPSLETSMDYYFRLEKNIESLGRSIPPKINFHEEWVFAGAFINPRNENEKQLYALIEELIPFERNGGWIPYDMGERIKMYPEAFEHFWKMRYIKKTDTTE